MTYILHITEANFKIIITPPITGTLYYNPSLKMPVCPKPVILSIFTSADGSQLETLL